MAPELAFVLAPRQNLFFNELVAALRSEASRANVTASLHVGNFPPPRHDLVYVLVPPHEYFTLMHGRYGPLPEVLKRTIFICAEQPNTSFFHGNVESAPRAGAVFDINRSAVRAFAQHGIAAEHLQLGWTEDWDHAAQHERDIDVLFMGSLSERRERALASFGRIFSRYRTELVLSDNSRPNWAPSESFRADDAKWDLLGRAKLLVNIHQGGEPYFEWLRIVQAMSNGAAVVSEQSIDFAPLVPGEHMLMGGLQTLDLLVEMLLLDDGRRRRMQTAAYAKLREELTLAPAVQRLVAVASEIAEREPVPDAGHVFFTQPQPDPDELPIVSTPLQPPSLSDGDANASWMRRALKDLRLEMLELRRSQARAELEASATRPLPLLEQVAMTDAYRAAAPRVSVLTALYNQASHVTTALSSVTPSRDCPFELIVVDDGSSDGSSQAVTRWMAEHRDTPALLLRHPVNRGLAQTRNDALGMARGEFCFVLDADNEVYPHCLSRLMQALDADASAAFAYGTLEKFQGSESVGLMGVLPWEPERLRVGNYIDAMSMIRTSVIRDEFGGYPTDRRLHGWEDYALWCALASAGHHGIRVAEIVGRYRVARHSMLSLTNISATDAFSVIIEANPVLMAGIEAPD
jgi:hypothetical protein